MLTFLVSLDDGSRVLAADATKYPSAVRVRMVPIARPFDVMVRKLASGEWECVFASNALGSVVTRGTNRKAVILKTRDAVRHFRRADAEKDF